MTLGSEPTYAQLLAQHQPGPVASEAEYDRLLALIDSHYPRRHESADMYRFVDLLTILVHTYESQAHALPLLPPIELLKVLMIERGFKQKDLLDVFKTKSIVSEVLSGRRELTREHIERLALKFTVSPAVFFAQVARSVA
jgi:HTH-type transcriptional regulator/antitoxin HigA